MTVWIIEFEYCGETKLVRFLSSEKLFEWLQEFVNKNDTFPSGMLVYKAECVFSGS